MIKKIFYAVCSVLVWLAMHCKMECVTGAETSSVLNGLYKLFHSFGYYTTFTDVFMIVAVYILICHVAAHDERYDKWAAGFSALLAASYIIASSYNKYDSAAFLLEDKYQMLLSGICFAGYFILFYCCLRLLVIYMEEHVGKSVSVSANDFLHRHFWLCGFLIIFICWLPWIIINYPGTTEPDSTYQLMQYFGDSAFTAHHPPLSTYIMGTLVVIGNFLWDVNFGIFLYILLQTVLGALIFSWSLQKVYELGIRIQYCMLGILYFAVLPLWGGYNTGVRQGFIVYRNHHIIYSMSGKNYLCTPMRKKGRSDIGFGGSAGFAFEK